MNVEYICSVLYVMFYSNIVSVPKSNLSAACFFMALTAEKGCQIPEVSDMVTILDFELSHQSL